MNWQIIVAGIAGVIVSYVFRYKVEEVLNFPEYLWFQTQALVKGFVGAAAVILLWPHIGTAINYLLREPIDWPPLTWQIAAVVGFAGRKVFEVAPQLFSYVAAAFGKRFEK